MKILYVSHYSELYGANLSLLNLLQKLNEMHDFKPVVLLPRVGNLTIELKQRNIEYHVRKFYSWYSKKSLKGFVKYIYGTIYNKFIAFNQIVTAIDLNNFDYIHTNSSIVNMGALIAKKFKIKHIWHIREFGNLDYKISHPFGNKYAITYISKLSYKVIFVSKSLKNYYSHKKIYDNHVVVYNGISQNKISRLNKITTKKTNIIMVGLIHPQKNQLIALKAMDDLVHAKDFKDIKLHIYGNGNNKYLDKLKNYVSSNNLKEYVEFKGYIKNQDIPFEQYSIGLMPSKMEAFGRVTIEYMLNKIAVVAYKSGGTQEIIKDNLNGLFYNEDNYVKLSEKIQYLLENPKILDFIVKNASESFDKLYNIERTSDNIYGIYKAIK